MIGRLKGELVEKAPPVLIVDIGGVGYEVEAPMSTFYKLPATGKQVTLHTQMIFREDAQIIYGFATRAERELFRDLIKISGVGGKLALTILSGIPVDDFIATVQQGDSAALTRLPGVGKKTAARLVVEMKDRLGSAVPVVEGEPGGETGEADAMTEAFGALTTLGYKPAEANKLLRSVSEADMDSAELIRAALKQAVK